MAIFRPDRSRRVGKDPFLLWKVRVFVVGSALGIAGMITGLGPLVWGAVAVLAVGVILRFADQRPKEDDEGTGSGR